MKKFTKLSKISLGFIFCFVLCFLQISLYNPNEKEIFSFAETDRISYAKAKDNCFLFRTSDVSNSNYTNVFFVVPRTYFVTVLNKINSFIFKVQYKNKIGYVASDSVTEVSFIPTCLTLDGITFDTLDMIGTQIRTKPNAEDNSNSIMIIPAGSTDIIYISYIQASVPSGGSSNVWYYAQYQPASDPTSVYEGYVYSEKTKNLSTITENSEGLDVQNEENFKTEDEKLNEYSNLNSSVKTVLILLICLPVVIIFILLLVGNKNKKNTDENDLKTKSIQDGEHKVYRPKHRSVESLKGKNFTEKSSSLLVSKEIKTDSIAPVFPTYEVIDDDDLL